MSTRISKRALLPLVLALAACGEQRTDHATLAKVEAEQRRDQDESGTIFCAHGSEMTFARNCTIERVQGPAGLILIVRNSDGAFHRLLVTRDGRGVIAADGAERATVGVLASDEILVAIGGDRYRLPATIKPRQPAT